MGMEVHKDARQKLLEEISAADAQKVGDAISQANLVRLAEQEETLSLTFHKEKNGTAAPYLLQTIRTRESDHHHVVIGVRPQ